MRVDVMHVGRQKIAVAQSPLHSPDRTVHAGLGDVMSIGTHAKTNNFAKNRRAAILRVLPVLKHQHAGAFA